jgi:hypothetical protein
VVTSAGASPEAQALLGKTVSIFVGGMYGQLRKVRAADCLVLPAGIKSEEAASAFGPLAVTKTQYAHLAHWASGNFVPDAPAGAASAPQRSPRPRAPHRGDAAILDS